MLKYKLNVKGIDKNLMNIEILNLYSNLAESRSNLIGKHGKSFLISIENKKNLFDLYDIEIIY